MRVNVAQELSRHLAGFKLSYLPNKKGWKFYDFYQELSAISKSFAEFQKKWLDDMEIIIGEKGDVPEDKRIEFHAAMEEPFNRDVEIVTKPFLTEDEFIDVIKKSDLSFGILAVLKECLVKEEKPA